MIDRDERDEMAGAIRDYLAERMLPPDFSVAIVNFGLESADETVIQVAWEIEAHVSRRPARSLDKAVWDRIQRVLLVLQSDYEVRCETRVRRGWAQGFALMGVTLFVLVWIVWGFGVALVFLSVPLGAPAFALWMRQVLREDRRKRMSRPLAPFSSIPELLRVRRAVTGFSKTPYPHRRPAHEPTKRIVSIGASCYATALRFLLSFIAMPVILIGLLLPEEEKQTRVVAVRR